MPFGGQWLRGKRIVVVGRLASIRRRELADFLRHQGAVWVERMGPEVDIVILGEEPARQKAGGSAELPLPPEIQQGVREGRIRLIRESQLGQEFGLGEAGVELQGLYTPAMVAELLRVPVAEVRRWYRRGWLRPTRLVHRLPYFDFQEVMVARRLAELRAAGASQQTIQRQMTQLSRSLPEVERPLSQLPLRIEGKRILLWRGDRLMEPDGQFRLDFDAACQPESEASADEQRPAEAPAVLSPEMAKWPRDTPPYYTPRQLAELALELEEAGQLREAAEMLRAAMAAGGATAEWCFQLAELLYRLGDLSAARERYYMAIELDEDFVEARCNLGCLLAEMGETELALAAFQGALAYHPHYADAHYQLARLLDELGRTEEAQQHWKTFLALAPESPWVQQARSRLGESP